jgi:putative FmdB family regulatory protein
VPIYEYECEEGHRHEVVRAIRKRKDPADCPTCGGGAEFRISGPGLARLEPIPMDRTGHRRRAAARRERITGEPSPIDYNSRSNNSFGGTE